VEQLISNAMAAQGHGRLPDANTIDRLPDVYAPGYLNADVDLEAVAAGIATHRSARLLLSGPPGTGKTAYGHWLAQKLSMPILVKKASDLMSKWVGGNERNIAAAFEQARTDKALLLIDEIDSFIQDRRDAARGWEITMVNEWLTQLEAFGGVFVASTNLIDGIDQAALRRFDLKVGFSAMKPEQAIALFGSHCATLGIPEPDAALIRRIGQMSILTPGDFAAVLRQHRFRPIGSTVQFVEALEREVGYKAGSRTGIGFL
jgi:SpoVK/Ycf46/Vps4 family AAA+-type ATPase